MGRPSTLDQAEIKPLSCLEYDPTPADFGSFLRLPGQFHAHCDCDLCRSGYYARWLTGPLLVSLGV
jgi:hypothetical protein